MSELLKKISDKKIKEKAIELVQNIFNTNDKPKEVIVSEFTIILKFQDCVDNNEGLNVYSDNNIELAYNKDEYGKLCIVNITSPEILLERTSPVIDSI